ncbi:unnamed protein product [Symbiodinium pilosum]|uniref:Uncharacterized protein n=1 Tax=Symbiodinium pilosum TaxID=2952 RepID=A0A812VYG5_SYMPI|nr:unnamed protein product [Symbiodinium pilosum]
MEARAEAVEMTLEGTVEALSWKRAKAEELADAAAASEADCRPLELEALLQRLRSCGARGDDEDYISELFAAWAAPGENGKMLSLSDFLLRYLEIARRLPSKQCGAPCEGGLPPGSEPLERELVRLVSRDGKGNWAAKAAELSSSFPASTAESLEALWHALAPKIKKVVDGDQPMACGHSCSTCPTKHTCQVHDAIKDIEDL